MMSSQNTQTAASGEIRRPTDDDRDEPPPPSKPKGRPGRPATVLPAEALAKLRKHGGKANGTVRGVGKLLGAKSKTAAHRLLHRLATEGELTMAATPHGISVALA
jgi:hypothetical protein